MRYVPAGVPQGGPLSLKSWLVDELRRIAAALRGVDNLSLKPLAAEPAKLKDGMVVYANGADWDPGSGAGVYARESGAWIKL